MKQSKTIFYSTWLQKTGYSILGQSDNYTQRKLNTHQNEQNKYSSRQIQ